VLSIDKRPLVELIVTPVGTTDGVSANEYVIGNVPADVVTWNVPPVPDTTLVVLALFMIGATGVDSTVNMKFCVALNNEFDAVVVKGYVPGARPVGIVIIPLEESIVTPAGIVPLNA